MTRREALKRIAALTGGALSVSTAAGVLGGCGGSDGDAYELRTLSNAQFERVGALAERILPTTDTPGAKAAGVPTFIDRMLSGWMTTLERTHFLTGLEQVEPTAQAKVGTSFIEGSAEQKDAVLRVLAEEAQALEPDRVTVDFDAAWDVEEVPAEIFDNGRPQEIEIQLRPFFSHVKELTLVGYYTSEVGATEELRYEHVPGRYDGCVPVEELGRAWA